MTAYAAVIQRSRSGCGRNENLTYVHVVSNFVSFLGFDTLAQWVSSNPNNPWNNTSHTEYLIEVTEGESIAYQNSGLFLDNKPNLPRWQQEAGNTGSTKNFGSYADPTNALTNFSTGIQLIDDRRVLMVFDLDPVANPTTAVQIGDEGFDETAATEVTRYIQLFDEELDPLPVNAGNQRTEVGGKLMDFDFGSSHTPSLSAGVTSFKVDISQAGTIVFPSNRRYRFYGPDEGLPNYYEAKIYGKVLRVEF